MALSSFLIVSGSSSCERAWLCRCSKAAWARSSMPSSPHRHPERPKFSRQLCSSRHCHQSHSLHSRIRVPTGHRHAHRSQSPSQPKLAFDATWSMQCPLGHRVADSLPIRWSSCGVVSSWCALSPPPSRLGRRRFVSPSHALGRLASELTSSCLRMSCKALSMIRDTGRLPLPLALHCALGLGMMGGGIVFCQKSKTGQQVQQSSLELEPE